MIQVEALNKSYGKHPVLKSVDFKTEKGKIYGIVGANGAGKTTFYRCIALLESSQGNIHWDTDFDKRKLAYLPTSPFYFDKMTGKEYLTMIVKAKMLPQVDLDQYNIFELPLEEYASHYSTGMKKKLAFTALLFQQNDFIILDEPFNGVDIQSNIMIVEIIRKWREAGKTVLISSHIFSTLSEVCDEIHLLEDGAFAQRVTPSHFSKLEEEMKQFILGDKLQRLNF